MKTQFVRSAVLISMLAISLACYHSTNEHMQTGKSFNGFAVVELFTSEGCSSCPPADEAVAKILQEYNNNVYVLGYHVDYWDNLGWNDIFSSAAYTQRQKNYAKVLQLSTIYTPQVIVNGDEQFVGSDKSKLYNSINNALKQTETASLDISARQDIGTVKVSYKTNATNDLNVVLVQLQAQNKIERGENHGATLHHVNVVREISTVPLRSGEGTITLRLPNGLSGRDCNVIAFTQNENDLKITSAAKADIQ